MGWKAFVVLATTTPGYFGTAPTHDPAAAEALRAQLGFEGYERVGEQGFDDAIYPDSASLFIGAYPGGCILCHQDLATAFFDKAAQRRIRGLRENIDTARTRLLATHAEGELMALVLHSVVNLWGYSVYAQGRLLRMAAGASDDGLFAHQGAPLPEEQAVLQRCPLERVDEEGEGEELVFDVSARMFGQRLDSLDTTPLHVTHYRRRPRFGLSALKKKLLGRG